MSQIWRSVRWLPSLLVVVPWLVQPAVPSNEVRIRDLSATVAFRLLDWETLNIATRAGRLWNGIVGQPHAAAADAELLRRYFSGPRRAEERPMAEAAIERVVRTAFENAGVSHAAPLPTGGLFPPVLVALTEPPSVLVISPRTELRVTASVILNGLDAAEQERLETSADSTGVSSLVAPIGGLATYPAMVLEDDSPERVLTAVVHEWLHNYLIFFPLGARYWDSQETREINETTADLVGNEVGRALVQRLELRPRAPAAPPPSRDGFSLRDFMRATRLETEQLLAAGQVADAESYMRARRDELERHGVRIRKLNQAYFALYGSYGGGFAASPRSPVPALLRQLRDQSGSLGEFLLRVRTLTTVEELRAAVA